jgi:hypothetical protein
MFLDIIHRPVFCNINRTVFLDKDRTMDNVQKHNTVKPVLNGISRVQNIFLLKPGFRLIKVYYDSHGT